MLYYLKKNWKLTSLVCFFQIVVWGIQAGVQLLLIWTFDAAMNFDFQLFMLWTVVSLLSWGSYFILCAVLDFFQAKAIRALNNQVRHDLCLTLLHKDYSEFHTQDSGEYISWMTNDIKQIERLAWEPFFDGVGRIAQVLWSMMVLFSLHWTLLLASVFSTAVMLIMPKLFDKRMEKMGKECSDAASVAVSRLKDLLLGADVLRCFNKGSRFLDLGDEVSDQIEEPNSRLTYTKSAVNSAMSFVSVVIQILSDILIVALAFMGKVQPATLAGSSNLFGGVTNGLNRFANLRLSLAASKPYFDKISYDSVGKTKDYQQKEKVCEGITVKNLAFQYGDKKIFENLTLKFEVGKKYALTGPSGCGKSTILKILLGWLPDYTGLVLLDDRDARTYSSELLYEQMSYIEQDVFLFNASIRENITLGESFTEAEIQKALHESALAGDLVLMPNGLETMVGENGNNLSGGQKQRVAIARALIHQRLILLVDEGTSALDQQNADIVERSLLSNSDLTLILISHHLSEERKKQFDQVYELK